MNTFPSLLASLHCMQYKTSGHKSQDACSNGGFKDKIKEIYSACTYKLTLPMKYPNIKHALFETRLIFSQPIDANNWTHETKW